MLLQTKGLSKKYKNALLARVLVKGRKGGKFYLTPRNGRDKNLIFKSTYNYIMCKCKRLSKLCVDSLRMEWLVRKVPRS